jgi:hypothetical protein
MPDVPYLFWRRHGRQRLYSTLTGIWQFGTWGKERAVSLFDSHPSVLIPMLSQRFRGFGFSLS